MKHNPAFFPREVTLVSEETQVFYSVVAIDVISGEAADSVIRIGDSDIGMPFPGRALEAISPVPELEIRAGMVAITLRIWTGDGSALRVPTVRDVASPVIIYGDTGGSLDVTAGSGSVDIQRVRGSAIADMVNTALVVAPSGRSVATVPLGRDSTGQGRPLRASDAGRLESQSVMELIIRADNVAAQAAVEVDTQEYVSLQLFFQLDDTGSGGSCVFTLDALYERVDSSRPNVALATFTANANEQQRLIVVAAGADVAYVGAGGIAVISVPMEAPLVVMLVTDSVPGASYSYALHGRRRA